MSAQKKKYLLAMVIFVMGVFLVSPAFAAPIVMRYSCGLPPTHVVITKLLPWYAAEIGRRTNGAVKIDVYGGAVLYNHDQVVDAVTTGAVDMAVNSATHWGGRNPVFGYGGYFFMVTSADQYRKGADKALNILGRLYEKQGAKMMNFMHYGSCGIISTKPINTPADFKGMKIRGPAAGHVDSVAALGGVPAKLAAAEVYDAIAKRAVDGAFSGYGSMWTRKWFEVAKYVVGDAVWDPWHPTMNLALWNRLPKDIQKVFEEVNKEFAERSITTMEADDKESIRKLREKGTNVKVLTPREAVEWAAAMEVGFQNWVKQCEKAGYAKEARELLNALVEAGK